MTDDDRIRSLLTLAADLPDDVQAPVNSLLGRARRRRRLRAAGSVAAAAAVVAAALTLPAALRSLGTGPGQVRTPPGIVSGLPPSQAGPTAAQVARFRWSSLPPSPLGPRSQPLLTWTGSYLIELGGLKKGNQAGDGAVYDPATRHWHRAAHVTANVGFSNAVEAWTGRQLFVANGQVASCGAGVALTRCLPRAGLYDPADNRWTYALLPKQFDGLTLQAAVWTGRDVVLAGVSPARARLRVAAYDPATGRWTMITPRLAVNHPPLAVTMVATPGRLILWSMWSKTTKTSATSYQVASGVDVLALARQGWTTVTGSWPQHQTVDGPVYAGGTIFLAPSQIWCGACSHPFAEFRSRLVNPATLAITQIPPGPLAPHPLVQAGLWLWTGRTAIAFNTTGQTSSTQHITQMAAFDPGTSSWPLLPAPPRDQPTPTPVWAGRQLFDLTSAGTLWAFHR